MKFYFALNVLVTLLLSVSAQGNVLGEMQTFAPNTDGLDFITVHSARPLNQGYFAFSNYLNFAKDHLLVYEDFPGQKRMSYSNHLIEYDFGISYGLTKTIQLSLMAPFLVNFEGETKNGTHILLSQGAHVYRPGTKWTMYQDESSFAAGLLSVDVPTVVNSPYTGVQPHPIFNAEFAYSTTKATSSHGYNLGYRKRMPSEIPADARMFPLRDQLIASYGYSTKVSESSRFVFELFSSFPLDKTPYDKATDASSIDALFAMKHFWWKYLRFDWGVTIAPPQQTLSPTWRAFAGLVYYWKSEKEFEKSKTEIQPAPNYEQAAPIEVSEFSVQPASEEIYTRSTLQIEVIGGDLEKYQYAVESGPGTISESGLYQAPINPGIARIRVSDRTGKAKFADIKIIAPPKADREIRLTNLEFITGKDKLIPSSKKYMDKNLKEMRKVAISKIIVEGHTDDVGSEESNLKLSKNRANAVRKILLEEFELPPKSVIAMGFGESKPLVPNRTARDRQKNRRVELKVYFKK
jgi:outer membrane protein OmpA-like peptidoglycan-associated protein